MATLDDDFLPPAYVGVRLMRQSAQHQAGHRLRSRGRRVSWAPDDKLCQIRLFSPEDAPQELLPSSQITMAQISSPPRLSSSDSIRRLHQPNATAGIGGTLSRSQEAGGSADTNLLARMPQHIDVLLVSSAASDAPFTSHQPRPRPPSGGGSFWPGSPSLPSTSCAPVSGTGQDRSTVGVRCREVQHSRIYLPSPWFR